jgi:hypothetical protein
MNNRHLHNHAPVENHLEEVEEAVAALRCGTVVTGRNVLADSRPEFVSIHYLVAHCQEYLKRIEPVQ